MKWNELFSLAYADTFGPAAKRVSIALIVTIAIVVASTLASFGIAAGAKRVSRLRLGRDPLAGCVLAGDEIRTQQQIPAAMMGSLESQLQQACPESQIDVCGYRSMVIVFQTSDGIGLSRGGRTYQVEQGKVLDPVAMRLLAEPPVFQPSGAEYFCPVDLSQLHGEVNESRDGLIVTQGLLARLGFSSEPNKLNVRVSQIPETLRVIKVVDQLPYNWSFLIPESYQEKLVALEKLGNNPLSAITTGKVSEESVSLIESVAGKGKAFDVLCEAARQQGVDISSANRMFDQQSRKLTISGVQLSYPEWVDLMDAWAEMLELPNNQRGFTEISPPKIDNSDELDYDVVTILASDYGALRTLADKAETIKVFQGFVDGESAKKVEAADEQTQLAIKIVWLFAAVLSIVAFLGIRCILVLNAEKRMREVGVLRVIGFSNQDVCSILRWQAMLIFLPSIAIGLLAGVAFGIALSWYQYQGDGIEVVIGFHASWIVVGVTAIVGFVVFLISATWVAQRWEKKDASELLRA